MALDPKFFIGVMQEWQTHISSIGFAPCHHGATEEELRGITAPACIIAGNDKIHTPQAARNLHNAMAGSELFDDVVRNAQKQIYLTSRIRRNGRKKNLSL